jgi:hypothetical protein
VLHRPRADAFPEKAPARGIVGEQVGPDHPQRHDAAGLPVLGPVDHAERPDADELAHDVPSGNDFTRTVEAIVGRPRART